MPGGWCARLHRERAPAPRSPPHAARLCLCPLYRAGAHGTVSPGLCRCSRGAPQGWVVRSTGPTRACDWCRKWGRGGPAGLSPEPLGSAPTPGSGSRGQTKLLDALPASRSWLRAGKPSPRSREEERAGRGQPGAGAAAHSPHPAVGFAVGRVYADGALAVLHRPGVVAQLAVGRGSAETAGGRPCVLAGGRAGPRGDRPRRPHTRPAGG